VSLTIELDAAEEARLSAAAREQGLAPAELARRVLLDHLPAVEMRQPDEATLALFRKWDSEDAERTPEQAQLENELWDTFQANVNETRQALGMRKL
jgi:hypothetical protein